MSALPSFDDFRSLVLARRTSLLLDRDRPVPADLVDRICELARWAPNHKKTWPWRFAEFTGAGRARLGETMVADMVDAGVGDDVKRTKTAGKYLRAPSVLVVGCTAHDNDMLHAENRDAVAAGVQNLLLGATAAGLASFWSTPALTQPPKTLDLCGFDAGDRIVGVVYLGWPTAACPAPERPELAITRIQS